MFPAPFSELLKLRLNISDCHGNDASQIHRLLHSTQKLNSLTLRLPYCYLEGCRIKGLTFDYHFSSLEDFSLHGWIDPSFGLADFLLRHSSIRTLSLLIDSEMDDDVEIASMALPNLRALALESSGTLQLLPQLLSSSASRQIKHLRLEQSITNCIPVFANVGQSLHCLELSTYQFQEWREDVNALSLVELLRHLPELLEFTVYCHTGTIYYSDTDAVGVQQAPLDFNDLVC
jgi:hypothetical protein